MKKINAIIAIAASAGLVATSIHASLLSSRSSVFPRSESLGVSFTIRAPQRGVRIDRVEELVGTSLTSPCSDLRTLWDEGCDASDDDCFVRGNYSEKILASDMEEDFRFGDFWEVTGRQPITCTRWNIYVNGRVYTSGNIEWTWDSTTERYVGVNPSSITFDFTS